MIEIQKVFKQDEIAMMNNYVKEWASTSDSRESERVCFEGILSKVWAKEKVGLYHLLGDKLTISKEVEFSTPITDLYAEIEEMFNKKDGFLRYCCDQRSQNYYSTDISWKEIGWLLNYDNLAFNQVKNAPYTIKIYDKEFKVQYGAKTIKLLGKIAEALHVTSLFEEFRLDHSRMLNRAKLKGELCLSIHPMDYMTMSDNDCDWSSCMSWIENGCYRRGTVEMMNSPYVVVAYLKSSSPMRAGGFNWNSKKWRTLIVLNHDMITTVKSYPYHSEDLSTAAVKWLCELSNGYYLADQIKECSYCSGKFYYPIENINGRSNTDIYYRTGFSTNDMYNDFGSASHFVALSHSAQRYEEYHDFCYSGATQCVWCGGIHQCFGEEEQLICEDCGGEGAYYYCECCESEYSHEDSFIWVQGYQYCENCVDEYCFIDDYDDEWYNRDYLIRIRLVDKEYNEDIDISVGYECLEIAEYNLHSKRLYELVPFKKTESGIYYVDFNKVTNPDVLDRVYLYREKNRQEYLQRLREKN